MAMWNTGYQINLAMQQMEATTTGEWRGIIIDILGIGYNPNNPLANIFHGFLYFFPVFLVCNMVGGLWEGLFAMVRKHEINEGFLVTGMLFPLTLPPTNSPMAGSHRHQFRRGAGQRGLRRHRQEFPQSGADRAGLPLFCVSRRDHRRRGLGRGRRLYACYPVGAAAADGMAAFTGSVTWMQAFLGAIPGSMGETSTLACLIGAAILIATRVGSWQIIASMTAATVVGAELLHAIGSDTTRCLEWTQAGIWCWVDMPLAASIWRRTRCRRP